MWGRTWLHTSISGVLCALLVVILLPKAFSGPVVSPASPAPAMPASGSGPPPALVGKGNHSSSADGGLFSTVPEVPPPNRPSMKRALAMMVLVSAAVIAYFVIRTIRTRRNSKKTRKYGVLDTNIGNMELTPLEQEDEDDDTLFDANNPRSLLPGPAPPPPASRDSQGALPGSKSPRSHCGGQRGSAE